MAKKSQSPVPKKSPSAEKKGDQLMGFPEAMRVIAGGGKVRRVEWSDPEEYCLMKDTYLMIHRKKEGDKAYGYHSWQVMEGDILAIDWVAID